MVEYTHTNDDFLDLLDVIIHIVKFTGNIEGVCCVDDPDRQVLDDR